MIAFIVAAAICFLLVMSGLEMVQNVVARLGAGVPRHGHLVDELPVALRADHQGRGRSADLVFYLSLIAFALFANKIIVDLKKAA